MSSKLADKKVDKRAVLLAEQTKLAAARERGAEVAEQEHAAICIQSRFRCNKAQVRGPCNI